MKIALFGVGDMGQLHLAMYKLIPGVEVSYIFGRNERKLKEIAKKFAVNFTTNPKIIYEDKSIIGVDICLPTILHKQFAVDCLKSGKHVMCEMPISFDVNEAKEMVNAANKNSKKLLVATLMPFVDEIKYVVDQVKSNKIGNLLSVYAYRFHQPYKKIDPIVELMTFEIDTILRILGIPYQVNAQIKLKENENILAQLKYANVQASVEMKVEKSETYSLKHGIKVTGEKGTIEASITFSGSGSAPPQSQIFFYPQSGEKQQIKIKNSFPYKEECRYFINTLLNKNDGNYISADKALKSLEIACKIKSLLKSKSNILDYKD